MTGAHMHGEFLVMAQRRQDDHGQHAALAPVKARPGPYLTPGAVGDVALKVGVEIALTGLGAVDMGIAKNRAPHLHAVGKMIIRQGASPPEISRWQRRALQVARCWADGRRHR